MRIHFLAIILGCALTLDLPEFYHTTSELNKELDFLSKRCQFIKLSPSSDPDIQLIDIRQGDPKYKAFILFGEHPRELISPETGVNFLRNLCTSDQSENAQILSDYQLRLILNANPISRQIVEKGKFCLRENENGVDLNRNYDAHWEQNKDDKRQITSGSAPFSEPETQAIRDALKDFDADIFLSVHSGALGLFTPHAYTENGAEENEDNMMDILEELQTKYCPSCNVGPAGKAVGYIAKGACLDYAYDELKVDKIFLFDRNFPLGCRFKTLSGIGVPRKCKFPLEIKLFQIKKIVKHIKALKLQFSLNFNFYFSLQEMTDEKCFHYFNPEDRDNYSFYIQNWTSAIQKMLIGVAGKKDQGL